MGSELLVCTHSVAGASSKCLCSGKDWLQMLMWCWGSARQPGPGQTTGSLVDVGTLAVSVLS